jgi:ribokinase
MHAVLADDGIDAAAVTSSTSPTGRALIVVDGNGENSIVVVPGANLDVTLPESLPTAGVVLCQLEVPLDQVAQALALGRRGGATTILNPAPAAPLPADPSSRSPVPPDAYSCIKVYDHA